MTNNKQKHTHSRINCRKRKKFRKYALQPTMKKPLSSHMHNTQKIQTNLPMIYSQRPTFCANVLVISMLLAHPFIYLWPENDTELLSSKNVGSVSVQLEALLNVVGARIFIQKDKLSTFFSVQQFHIICCLWLMVMVLLLPLHLYQCSILCLRLLLWFCHKAMSDVCVCIYFENDEKCCCSELVS